MISLFFNLYSERPKSGFWAATHKYPEFDCYVFLLFPCIVNIFDWKNLFRMSDGQNGNHFLFNTLEILYRIILRASLWEMPLPLSIWDSPVAMSSRSSSRCDIDSNSVTSISTAALLPWWVITTGLLELWTWWMQEAVCARNSDIGFISLSSISLCMIHILCVLKNVPYYVQ